MCADQQLQSLKMEPPTVDSSAVKKADSLQTTEKRYVLVLYTGGTIGMKESPDGKSAYDACKLVSFLRLNRNVNLLVIKLSIFNFLKCYHETCNTKIFSHEKGLQEGNWLTVTHTIIDAANLIPPISCLLLFVFFFNSSYAKWMNSGRTPI